MNMRAKITLGFAVVIAVFLGAVVLSISSLRTAAAGFVSYAEMAEDSNLAGELQIGLLMVRMNVKDFIITGSDTDLQQYEEYFTEVGDYMEIAQVDIENPERARLIDDADEKIREYNTSFEELVSEVEQITGLQTNSLDVIGPRMEQNLTSIMNAARNAGNEDQTFLAAQVLRDLLLARIYVNRFIESSSLSEAQRVRSEFTSIDNYMNQLSQAIRGGGQELLFTQVENDKAEYLQSFESLVGLIGHRDATISNQLDVIGPQIAEDLDGVTMSVIADQHTLGLELEESNRLTMILLIVISIAAGIMGIAAAMITVSSILAQLGKDPALIEAIMKQISLGDLDVALEEEKARGVYLSAIQMVRSLQYKADRVEQVAAGDLSIDIELASQKDVLGSSLQKMKDSLNDVLGRVNIAAMQVSTGSGQVSDASQSLSQGASEQASSLEEIASSLTEVNAQARQNAENANEANSLATQASKNAGAGSELMDQLLVAMGEINGSSEEIRSVVKVIDDIAFQINLLALNANVEAARAGKYGRGFAVVAEEVRNLATRSAEAVKETTSMVDSSISSIEKGNKSARETAEQLGKIVEGVTKVADFLGEISSASNEQAVAIDEISGALDQIGQVTQSNTASAEQSAAASEELAAQAAELQSMISRFKLERTTRLLEAPDGYEGRSSHGGQGRYQQPQPKLAPPSGNRGGSPSSTHGSGNGAGNRQNPGGAPGSSRTGSGPAIAKKPGTVSRTAAVQNRGSEYEYQEVRPEDIIRLDDDEFQDF